MPRVWRKLIEIRLGRSDKVVYEFLPNQLDGLWIPDTPRQRARLAEAVEQADRRHGYQTHWIEEREA